VKSLILVTLFLSSTIGFGFNLTDIKESSKQFENRNWNYDAVMFARKAHVMNYADVESLTMSRDMSQNYVTTLDALTYHLASAFYPNEDFGVDQDVITRSQYYYSLAQNYDVLLGMSDFLSVLATEKWENESTGCDTDNPINNSYCGRQAQANWVINNLSSTQRDNLANFIDVVLDELQLIGDGYFNAPPGPEIYRVFQFLFDDVAIARMINSSYLRESKNYDQDLYKINVIEFLRALMVQIFQGANGRIENSGYYAIDLEMNSCFSKSQNLDCQLGYLRKLFANYQGLQTTQMTDQMVDLKVAEAISQSYVANFKLLGYSSLDLNTLQETGSNILDTFEFAYNDFEESTLIARMDVNFKNNLVKLLKNSCEYLIRTREIIALQMSKALGDVLRMLE